MRGESYDVVKGETGLVYRFVSEGPNGKILKVVMYQETEVPGVYNLAFGDYDLEIEDFDDRRRSNNGDAEKVLTTVVSTLFPFTDMFPDAIIVAKGSTDSRTRLYQIGIAKHLKEIEQNFEVCGLLDGALKRFDPSERYKAFAARRIRGP